MSLDSDTRFLSSVPFLRDFPTDALRLLAFGSSRHTLPRDGILYESGTLSDGGYIIERGAIELRGDGEPSTYNAGVLIGDIALISETTHSTSAVALEDSVLVEIPRPLFLRVLGEYPQTASLLISRIGTSTQEFINHLEGIAERLNSAPPPNTPSST